MNPHLILTLLAVAAVFLIGFAGYRIGVARGWPIAANIAEGTHAGAVTKQVDAVISTRFLLAKIGTDIDHVDICGVADQPLGVMNDEAAAIEDYINVNLFGSAESTQKMVASEAITAGSLVFTVAGGKVQNEPATAQTCYLVGRAITAAGADGDIIEVDTQEPLKLVVIAAFVAANNDFGGLSFSSTVVQAEAEALADATEVLLDDLLRVQAALATPALLKIVPPA